MKKAVKSFTEYQKLNELHFFEDNVVEGCFLVSLNNIPLVVLKDNENAEEKIKFALKEYEGYEEVEFESDIEDSLTTTIMNRDVSRITVYVDGSKANINIESINIIE